MQIYAERQSVLMLVNGYMYAGRRSDALRQIQRYSVRLDSGVWDGCNPRGV